ncbi:MAG: hypothetical protein JSU74_07670 [Candidatus Zixiibacteriota bacterium]|nr:MAG: hypothetical protein JSU74_07670 [candidate division Zixibacteria bacterium]
MRTPATAIIRFSVKPYGIVVVTVILSFLAWLIPELHNIDKGFEQSQELLSLGGLTVLVWYSLIVVCAWLFFRLGRASEGLLDPLDRSIGLHDYGAYCFLSAVGFVGFVYVATFMISSLGFESLLTAVVSGEANTLHKKLYEDYSIGFFSLRYVVILSGGLAIYRIISRISRSCLDIANILMLLVLAVIASRLSVVFALLIGLGLWVTNCPRIRVKFGRLLLLLAAVFVLFSLYNYSRNVGYYTAQGIDNFFAAGISEIVRYLASPFQGGLAAGNHLDRIIADPARAYLYTGIDLRLSTNSTLLGLIGAHGYLFIPIMLFTLMVSAFLMGMVYRRRDKYLILVYFVLLYCYAEIWRIYMFRSGIVITLLVFSLLAPFASRSIKAAFRLLTCSFRIERKSTPEPLKGEVP